MARSSRAVAADSTRVPVTGASRLSTVSGSAAPSFASTA